MVVIGGGPAKAIRESIELINRLTSGEQGVSLSGDIIQFGPGQLDFLPARRTPIYVAGRGPRVLEAAGAMADGVVVGSYATREGIEWALSQAARGARSAGRCLDTVDKVSWLYTCVAKDRQAAQQAVRTGVAVAVSGSRNILEQISVELPPAVLDHMDAHGYRFDRSSLAQLGALLPEELVARFSVAGTVAEVIEQLGTIKDLGMGQAALWPFPADGTSLTELVEVLGTQVLPEFLS